MLPGMSNQTLPPSKNANDGNLIDELDRFELWFASTWRWLWRGAIAVVIVVGAVISYKTIQESANKSAYESFYNVSSDTKLTRAEKAEAFSRLISENPNRTASILPRFDVAAYAVEQKKYDEAIAMFEGVVGQLNTPEFFKARAELNIAYIKELQGKKDEALSMYMDLNNKYQNAQYSIEASYAAARLQGDKGAIQDAVQKLRLLNGPQLEYSPYMQLVTRATQIFENRASTVGAQGPIGANIQNISVTPAPAADSPAQK